MVHIILVGITVALILFKVYKYMTFKPPNFPPGPPRIPIFGSYLFLFLINSKHLYKAVEFLFKFYKSNTIGAYVGGSPAVITNSREGIMEILNRQEFSGRPDIYFALMRDPHFVKRGILFNDGPVWKEQKHFMVRHLRDFGFGRRSEDLEILINEELVNLVDIIRNGPNPQYSHEKTIVNSNNVLCPDIFYITSANILLHMLCGVKLDRSEYGKLLEVAKYGAKFQHNGDDFGKLFNIVPSITQLFPDISGYKEMKAGSDGYYKFIKSLIEENYKKFDRENPETFLDLYFAEIEKTKDDKSSTFKMDEMILNVLDFFLAANINLPVQLALFVQHLVLNPEVQKKIQAEIDTVVGSGRYPTLDDRQHMPYTEAMIREAMRMDALVPSNVPHLATEDTTFQGYNIPKNCLMVTALDAFNTDPNVWENPKKFMPERFLDADGKLSLEKDITVPFGAGKRVCAGEVYARNMEFLIVSTLLQNFTLKVPSGEKPLDRSTNMTGIITFPKDFWVHFKTR